MVQRAVCAYVYMIRCNDSSLYTGWTTDLQRRVHEHSTGRGSRYTRSRRPIQLVFSEKHPSPLDAMRREAAIKSLPRIKKLALIAATAENASGEACVQ